MEENELFSAGPLVPHRGKMKLLEWVRKPIGKTLRAEAVVKADWPLYSKGSVSSVLSIELVAQTIAALRTWTIGKEGRPKVGFLVGVKAADFSSPTIPEGTRLVIQIVEKYMLDEYAVYEGQVGSEEGFIGKMTIQVLEADEKTLSEIVTRQGI